MTAKLILALLLAFVEPAYLKRGDVTKAELRAFANALAEYSTEAQLEFLAKAYIENGFRNRKRSSAGYCCWTQQSPHRKRPDGSPKPSCEQMEANAKVCLHETKIELDYWKYWCGESYLDAYRSGWKDCCGGRYQKRNPGKEFRCRTKRTEQMKEWVGKFKAWAEANKRDKPANRGGRGDDADTEHTAGNPPTVAPRCGLGTGAGGGCGLPRPDDGITDLWRRVLRPWGKA